MKSYIPQLTEKGFKRLLYHQWQYTAQTDETAVIQPDGWRDLIVVSQQGARDEIRVTGWDFQPHVIHLQAGTELTGYRLRPGTTVASEAFMNDDSRPAMLVGNRHYATFDQFTDAILDFFRKILPDKWREFRDTVADNFRVVSVANYKLV